MIYIIILLSLITSCARFNSENAPEISPQKTKVLEKISDSKKISNLSEIIQKIGVEKFHQSGFCGSGIKVAILDNGFQGLDDSIKNGDLPQGTNIEPFPGQNTRITIHGTKMAELVYGIAKGKTSASQNCLGPEILLFNTSDFTNFSSAIDQVIHKKINIVVYSQVYEFGGNFDGKGFINEEVNRAIESGVIWVNAAGNYRNSIFETAITLDEKANVKLPYENNFVRLLVTKDSTNTRIVLSWNDFTELKTYRSKQDLDLLVLDQNKQIIASSQLIQDGILHGEDDKQFSAHAREAILSLDLNQGIYYLAVKAKTNNFRSDSKLRISINGVGTKILEGTPERSLMIPADNPNVLTVGAIDSDASGFGIVNGISKPEIRSFSKIVLDQKTEIAGSSTAAAIVGGAIAVYWSALGGTQIKLDSHSLKKTIQDKYFSLSSKQSPYFFDGKNLIYSPELSF